MTPKELLIQDVVSFSNYVKSKKDHNKLSNNEFGETVNISGVEIGRIINRDKSTISIYSFNAIVSAYDSNFQNAIDLIFPHRNFKLKDISMMQRNDKLRTSFGQYMMDNFEDQKLKEISTENDIIDVHLITGIELPRLKNIYFNGGAPQVFEFILIEKAMGMDPGQMIRDFIMKYPV